MPTVNYTMDGTEIPVAGAGAVTVTPRDDKVSYGFQTAGGGALGLAALHTMESDVDKSLDVPTGEELHLKGSPGIICAVTRDQAPA